MEIYVCKMATFSPAMIANITLRLHEKRGRIQENMELRHKMLKASYHMQLKNEKNDVMSHIHQLQAGPRKLFLQMRLEKINAKLK
jgi:hypothetical protein